MMNQRHETWTDQLSDYLDDALDGAHREALEEHLRACPTCRTVLEELQDVVATAHELGEIQPPRDLWPGIASALGAPEETRSDADVIHLPTAARPRRRSGLYLTMPQLAAASVVLALASAAATWWVGPGLASRIDEPSAAAVPAPAGVRAAADVEPPPELAGELQVLEKTLAEARDKLDPNTVRILEKNLGVIDRAIDESRRALALDPANAFLRDHLERAYRDKVDYLRQAAGIAEWAG